MRFLMARLQNPLPRREPKLKRRDSGARRPARRKAHKAVNWRLRLRIGLAAVPVTALIALAWLWHSGWVERRIAVATDAALVAMAEAGLAVDDVLVEGRNRTRRSRIMEALGVERDLPILSFDPHAARRALEQLPWVRRATVERRLPDVIFVRLAEREPLALWQYAGQVAVIDREGTVIPGAGPETFAELPLLVGKDAPQYATALIAMLDREPDLKQMVSAAVRIRGRRWNLRLDSGIDVHLPEADPSAAWTQLARIHRGHGILGRDVVAIDLRIPDRLVVRTAPDAQAVTARPRDGEET